ncbi:MAG: MMPL family transporter, partial [Halobacteriovoraceae bacterium]|nr:MMPL family transporter [Halobacteriovoraceae bacterium]
MLQERKKTLVDKITDLACFHPWKCITSVLLLLCILAPGLANFKEAYDVRIWFRETDPNIKILDQFERKFGNDENLVIVLHSPSGVFDPSTAETIRSLTEDLLASVHQVIRVDSLSNYNYTYADGDEIIVEPFFPDPGEEISQELLDQKKKTALAHKVMPGYLVSKDTKSAMLFARLVPTLDGSPNYRKIVADARKLLKDKYQGKDDHQFHILGEAAVNDAFREIGNRDVEIIVPILFLLIILYMLFVFRSVKATLLPLVIIGMSIVMTLGLCFMMGMVYNSILTILPTILIAISIADSVHVIVTYFQFRALGIDSFDAAYKATHKNIIPTFLTSISTMIGFFSLTMTELVPIRQLGILAGIGCALAWIITIFFLCPLLTKINFKVPKTFTHTKDVDGASPLAHLLVQKLKRYITPILVIFVLATGISTYLGSLSKVNSNPYEYFLEGMSLRVGNDFVRDNFGGNAGPEIIIYAGSKTNPIEDGIKNPEFLRKVENYKNWIDSQSYVNKTVDIIDIIKDMNKSLYGGKEEQYKIPSTQKGVAEQLFLYSMSLPQGMDLNNRMTLKYDAMRMSVLWSIFDTRGWLHHADLFEKKAAELGLHVEITGKFLLFQRMMGYVVETFVKSVSMAVILIALLMMLVFRSVKIGLLSMLPNLIPLAFGGAFMKIMGIDLNIGSALVSSVCLGIAVDDTIHFLSAYY